VRPAQARWTAQFGLIKGDPVALMQVSHAMLQETGVYRKRFHASKR
jgi:hypothetical protein